MSKPLQPHQIGALAEKWLNGTITEAELQLLENWYHEEYPSAIMWRAGESEAALREKIYQEIIRQTEILPAVPKRTKTIRKFWWAAAIITLLLTGAAIFTMRSPRRQEGMVAHTAKSQISTTQPVSYTRSVRLPDGSMVLLHANSVLHYPAQFTNNTREVTLEGEAYFDVMHDKAPFVIHSGGVKTTVLGTAFNIRAYPGSGNVNVTVLRGRVKVENTRREVVVLTPNQQVTYNTATQQKVLMEKIDSTAGVTNWVQQDMVFEDVSFQTVAELLGRRYGTVIRFKNPALSACTIKAFFSGTEPLDKVLESLCLISNASFTIQEGNTILLDGEGCKQ